MSSSTRRAAIHEVMFSSAQTFAAAAFFAAASLQGCPGRWGGLRVRPTFEGQWAVNVSCSPFPSSRSAETQNFLMPSQFFVASQILFSPHDSHVP